MKYSSIILFLLLGQMAISQCLPDRHSTSWFDAWVSCEKADNPHPDRTTSHWIMYDLGRVYELGESHFWNINDPSHLDQGLQKALIDVSYDGVHWEFVDTLFLEQGPGLPVYEGQVGPAFDDRPGRYVLITIVDTYGAECGGFAELRVEKSELTTNVSDTEVAGCLQLEAYPNPYRDKSLVRINSSCGQNVDWMVTNTLGQVIKSGDLRLNDGTGTLSLEELALPEGQYLLSVQSGTAVRSINLQRYE